jgi:hypothetical protein
LRVVKLKTISFKKIVEIYKSLVAIGFLYFVSSKLKIGLEVNHGGFSAITIGDMSSKLILEFAKCDFKR